MFSRSSSLVLNGLQRATRYRVQVRARSQAGYGSFGAETGFNTLPDGTRSHAITLRGENTEIHSCVFVSWVGVSQLMVTGVSASLGILVLAVAAIVGVFCYR